MASTLDSVFKAEPKSVSELFLSRGTVGFYIPAYQREYSWDEDNLNRLMEDICQGICTYTHHPDAITFIGTIISILDRDYQTIKPFIRAELPSEVMSVIDGQQRLTTLSLIVTSLYQNLCRMLHSAEKLPNDVKLFLNNQINPLLNSFRQILEIDRFTNDPIYRFYPKITRAYVDMWSTEKETATYESPIASYLFGFIQYYRQHDLKPKAAYQHVISESIPHALIPKHKRVIDNVAIIKKTLDLLFNNGGDEVYRFPDINDILCSPELQERLIGPQISSHLIDLVKDSGRDYKVFTSCLNALIFSSFFLNRVAVTNVVATNETYAFDMFEALNTTGEPLTAFETFKPKVIDAEGIKDYEASQSRVYIEKVDTILDKYKKADDKHNATTRLLTPYRLTYEGESLSKHLSDQRRFLNKSFDQLAKKVDKQKFVQELYEMSVFLDDCWPEKKITRPPLEAFSDFDTDELAIELDMLRQANHSIVIGIIFRYFSLFLNSKKQKKDFDNFAMVVKAVVGFFVIWRSSRYGTDSIDSVYREILRNGVKSKDGVLLCGPVCIIKCPIEGDLPTLTDLKNAFTFCIEKKIESELSKDTFIKLSKNISSYKNNRALSRYLLLVSGNDSISDNTTPGLLVKGVKKSAPLYTYEQWIELSTTEHIYPQSASEGWDSSLTDIASPHVLGNLVLLPSYINSSLGNRPWEEKRLIYQMLAAKTIEVRNSLYSSALSDGVELSFTTEQIAVNASLMQQLEAIGSVKEWNKAIVAKRSANLYSLVWDEVHLWIKA